MCKCFLAQKQKKIDAFFNKNIELCLGIRLDMDKEEFGTDGKRNAGGDPMLTLG